MQGEDGYCTHVQGVDGLPLRCVGDWGQKKVFVLKRYFKQVGTALKQHELNYIEICSGPGRCVDFRSGDEFDGSPLAILKSREASYFRHLFFFDHDENTVEILKERVRRSSEISQKVKDITIITTGDYNEAETIIDVVRSESPYPWLNLVFIDPTDVSVPFSLSAAMMSLCERTDFIINFVDGIDLKRNIVNSISLEGSRSKDKYSRVLSDPLSFFDHEEILNLAGNHDIVGLVERFVDEFLKPFREKGYEFVYQTPILHYYRLYLLSRNELGRKFWENATAKTIEEAEYNQGLLFGY
jgi:three-Cys-motif partner protein